VSPPHRPLPATSPFADWLGIALETLGDGHVVMRMQPREETRNRRGVVHGGVLASLLDSAMARAARTVEGVSELGGTTDLHVQFLRPALGELRAEAWVRHAGGTLAFCHAELRDASGTLVCTGSASLRLRRRPCGPGEA
jgi:acyl-CoA thioesterase